MWLMTSQELVVVLYMKIAVVSLSSESFPPTASSCPCSDTHVDKVTGVSAIAGATLYVYELMTKFSVALPRTVAGMTGEGQLVSR